jgi:PAS domain S-box-containing protein
VYEEELDRYWKTVVSTIRDGVMIVDTSGAIVSVNEAFESITGYSCEELIGKKCSILNCSIHELARERDGAHWCVLFKNGNLDIRRCSFIRKDGVRVHALKNASLLRDNEGRVIGAVETITDITEVVEKDNQIAAFRRELRSHDGFQGIIGSSASMRKVFDMIANAAQSDAPVIVYGESGTGKELVSRAIHDLGRRKQKPFVKVNCASLTESLLESELFGHVKGAYTGAFQNRVGRFEMANGGDMLLDEIGDMPLSTQVKLLRVLEEKVIERVGDSRHTDVDVRIISATNKNLPKLVEDGVFRKDFFFRVNVIPIMLPPLRDRLEDIPLLAESFFRKTLLKSGKPIEGIGKDAMEVLVNYSWPGNVRELKSAFEYSFVTCQEPIIQPWHLPPCIFKERVKSIPRKASSLSREELKKKQLMDALIQADGNESQAARILGVSRVTVWNRMKKYGIKSKRKIECLKTNDR